MEILVCTSRQHLRYSLKGHGGSFFFHYLYFFLKGKQCRWLCNFEYSYTRLGLFDILDLMDQYVKETNELRKDDELEGDLDMNRFDFYLFDAPWYKLHLVYCN